MSATRGFAVGLSNTGLTHSADPTGLGLRRETLPGCRSALTRRIGSMPCSRRNSFAREAFRPAAAKMLYGCLIGEGWHHKPASLVIAAGDGKGRPSRPLIALPGYFDG